MLTLFRVRSLGLLVLRGCLLIAIALVLGSALSPADGPGLIPWDKARHFIAFYILASLGALAFPRVSLVYTAIGLALFGVLIEILQGLVGRDRSTLDVVADVVGIAAALTPFATSWWRRRFQGQDELQPSFFRAARR